MISLMTLTNHPGAALLPCGITSHSKRHVGVQKAVRGIVSLCTAIWWKEETRSKSDNIRPQGMGSWERMLSLFSFL